MFAQQKLAQGMFGPGFFHTRADLAMDIVMVSLVVIVPLLYASYRSAQKKQHARHRMLQVSLVILLFVAVSVFEVDLRLAGGFHQLVRESAFADTRVMALSLFIHLACSVSTAVLWITLTALSLKRMPIPFFSSSFAQSHRRLGRVGMIGMILTAVTGIELYVLGFVL
jgi:putative membrane protein